MRYHVVPLLYCPVASAEPIIPLPKDIDYFTCYKTLPTKSITCLPVGPCPLSGRWLYLQDLINTALHLPMKIPRTNTRVTLFQLTHILCWRRDTLQPPQVQQDAAVGFLDAFVYAHHLRRRIIENPGNFGDCMKSRIRSMTAITPAYAHASQATCLARHMHAVPHQNFRPPKLKARYPYLPNARSTTRERGNDFRGWVIYTDGGTRVVEVKLLLDGASSLDLTMKELMSCSAPRLISLSLVPKHNPTTLLK